MSGIRLVDYPLSPEPMEEQPDAAEAAAVESNAAAAAEFVDHDNWFDAGDHIELCMVPNFVHFAKTYFEHKSSRIITKLCAHR